MIFGAGSVKTDGLKIGGTGELEFAVEEKHGIDFADGEMPNVLSTPWLVWFLEHAAREAVLPCLEPGESTVGAMVEVEHLAPSPIGAKVRCVARVVQISGRSIWFRLEAHDDSEPIARGHHHMRVIDKKRLADRVDAKRSKQA